MLFAREAQTLNVEHGTPRYYFAVLFAYYSEGTTILNASDLGAG